MKKWLPYIVLTTSVVILALLFIAYPNKKNRVFNETVTLRMRDKIPYGMYVAYSLLPHLFPNAKVRYDKESPGSWDSISSTASNQAVVIMTKNFDADDYELQKLFSFAKEGNYVFIVAHHLSYKASSFFNCVDNINSYDFLERDSLEVALEHPPFINSSPFGFPGKTYESYLSTIDTGRTLLLGRGTTNGVNFIRLKIGEGAVSIHLSPLAFSNYFLLHKENIEYYKNVFSILPQNISTIVWNEYYLSKPKVVEDRDQGWFRVLMRHSSFRWGLLTAIGTLLLFILLEMRRKQRAIPELTSPKNDSLEFVKTIGRLYFDKADHKNLAHKMGTYFLDYLRTHYKLPTHTIDESFIESVHIKTGYPLVDVTRLIRFIQFTETAPAVSEFQLADFHKQLELFYQKT